MLEIVFNDSTKGSIKVAKHYDAENMLKGPFTFFGDGPRPTKKELAERFAGKPIGGNSSDVVALGFALDVGDISGEIAGAERRDVYRYLFNSVEFTNSEMDRIFANQKEDFQRILEEAKRGEILRVWKSHTPASICGYAALCSEIKDIDCCLKVIQLPEFSIIAENTIQEYSDWSELEPGKLYKYLELEREVNKSEKRLQSSLWNKLRSENAPLRALVNGRLISVPEDFYDHILEKNIPSEPFLLAKLIGKILGEYHLGVGDGWYALRIKKMIDEGKLEVVEDLDKEHPYGKILKLREQI